jgi:hypothetical protein
MERQDLARIQVSQEADSSIRGSVQPHRRVGIRHVLPQREFLGPLQRALQRARLAQGAAAWGAFRCQRGLAERHVGGRPIAEDRHDGSGQAGHHCDALDRTVLAHAGHSYQVDHQNNSLRGSLLHWDGRRWQAVLLPAGISGPDMAQDCHGGVWLAVNAGSNDNGYMYHYSGGRWTRQAMPQPKGYNGDVCGMSWISGTTSVWAVGEADGNFVNGSLGVIDKYGR